MIRKFILPALIALPFLAMSQNQPADPVVPGTNPFQNDPNARMGYVNPNDVNAEGSPFLQNQYLPMEITLVKGSVFKNVKARFNAIENELFFLAEGGRELITTTPIKSLRYMRPKEDESGGMEEVLIESFNSALNVKGAPIYEVLSTGKARLLKQVVSSFSDVRKYPEGLMARVYKKKTFYTASINDQPPVKFEKNKTDVLALFPNKQAEIKSFLEKEKNKCRTEEELLKVFNYYSSLD